MMNRFFAAIGRFKMDWFLSAALFYGKKIEENTTELGNWGVVYCHGNRLETVRIHHKKNELPALAIRALKEAKTDMALAYQHHRNETIASSQVQPLIKREKGENWAFCCAGSLPHPKIMFPNWEKIPDNLTPGELLFVFVFDRFRVDNPVESFNEILSQMPEENDLAFCLMTAQMMVLACRLNTGGDNRATLWLGRGELLMAFCFGSPPDLPDVVWEKLPAHQVIYIKRERWAVV